MKVTILTLGCKVNQSESAVIEGNLRRCGYTIVPISEDPDFCIINTCSVTTKSDYQSRQIIRRAVRSGARVFVTGCYSELQPAEIGKIDPKIEIVQNADKFNLIQLIVNNTEGIRLCFSNRSRPYVKVQDGCNYSCSYCIVPKARGKSKSKEISSVLDEALDFEALGYNEIVLTGIHLGLYGMELRPKLKLADLLTTLLKRTTMRIRLSSIEVNEIDEDLMEVLSEGRVCRHLHIPLQSGSNSVLERMKRRYTSEYYMNIIERLLLKVPNIALGTDIIVGFPGEEESEYLQTRTFVESVPFAYAHIFPFSVRPGTPAARMPAQVSVHAKKMRYNDLNALCIGKKEAYASSHVGQVLDVIVEGHGQEVASSGTSSNYLRILMRCKEYPQKSLVRVRITGREGNFLVGVPIGVL